MSKTDVPAGPAGGGTEVPNDRLPEDLPAKIRVHALAKLLGLTSKDVLAALTEIGSPVPSASSTVARAVAIRVAETLLPEPPEPDEADADEMGDVGLSAPLAPVFAAPQPLFMPPQPVAAAKAQVKDAKPASKRLDEPVADLDVEPDADELAADQDDQDDQDDEAGGGRRRRRRGRRGRGRGKGASDEGDADDEAEDAAAGEADEVAEDQADEESAEDGADEDAGVRRRRRRRRRKGTADEEPLREDDPPDTVVHFRDTRPASRGGEQDDGVQGVKGSTRLEAKRQRRRDGREAGRRRPPILSEAEFLARRESVDRTMVVREHEKSRSENGLSVQIGVLEDGVLVEHFVTSAGSGSLVGNVYQGRVQNVLPSMEAAFVDIGRGRNAVLYAGEVDWDAAGLEGKARKIEQALSTGDSVLVQVTKDPVGHKGARLTTQISLAGRFLVYVPGGGATGISRKLPDTERRRLKEILKRIVPEDAGVIIRTASEGISEDALGRDVRRLQAQWEVIRTKSETASSGRSNSPQLLYEEPDLLIKVVRDLFTEDFAALVVQGADAWDTIDAYIRHVAPDLASRLRRHVGLTDVFTEFRVDEQITKALDRKVWLPSGGYLVIDRTEAMSVIDVNTGKFTGAGGNLEETVTRNNLEAAEEIVRQLRLRDIGGIIVIDFIDMVLESNRDLVLRRLTECLGRDRTRHQVAEVTSLGLVQMTRKRVGTGLLEAYSQPCEHCRGRGVVVTTEPVERQETVAPEPAPTRRSRARGKTAQSDAKPADSKAAQTKQSDSKPAETKPAETKPAETKPAETKPAASVPTASQPARSRSAGSKSARSRSVESGPVESGSVDIDAADAEPAAAARQPVTGDGTSTAAPAIESGRPAGRRRTRRGEAAAQATGQPAHATDQPVEPPGRSGQPDLTAPAPSVTTRPDGTGGPDHAGPPESAGRPDGAAGIDGADGRGGAAQPDVARQQADGGDVDDASSGGASDPDALGDGSTDAPSGSRRGRRRRAASRPAGPPVAGEVSQAG